jgi:hypothetical protein
MVKKARITNEPLDRKVELTGLRTADDPFEVGFDGLVIADNVDMRRQAKVTRRPGFVDTGYIAAHGPILSAWADKQLFLFQEEGHLHRFISATDTPLILGGLTVGGKLSAYRLQNNNVFWSNGFETGVVEPDGNERRLGITPPGRDVGSEISGNIGAGRHSYTWTFVAADGRESGAPLPTTVELPENSGLSFTFSAGLGRNFWITECNGEELYLAATVAAGETTLVYRASSPLTSIPLDKLLMAPPSPWRDIDWFRASLLWAVEDRVEWSNTFDYELRDLAKGYMMFGERVNLVAGLQNGFYVGTENAHWWLEGDDMQNLSLVQVADYGAINGTKVHINGAVVGTGESTERIPMWTTERGVVMGLPGGSLRNTHENKVDFPGGKTGTALYRNAGRQNHYITRILG